METAPAYGHELRHDPEILRTALAGAARRSFWLDDPARPESRPALAGDVRTDLLVVGGGYCGLWTALIAKERNPERDVVLVEGRRIGWAASGRNGGFVEASLTHGAENGELHFAAELPTLDRLAEENFEALVATVERYGIDAHLEREPTLTVATEEYQARAMAAAGGDVLGGAELAAYADSPLFRAGRLDHHGNAFCTRPSSPGASPAPLTTSASGSTRTHRRRRCGRHPAATSSARRAGASTPRRSRWPPTASPRC